jgi:hypothetical protein
VATIVFDVINKVISEPGRTATTIHYNWWQSVGLVITLGDSGDIIKISLWVVD